MPLHGKIVVIRRGGGDGTEFPLTAACMFGRKIDCDIRIQLPQVSKEHCRVDINENKEVVLTNLSSVNPTCINGMPMQQSERLKHGDIFTIIDRSFRFEAPPPPTPKKKRVSTSKTDHPVQVLKEHQGRDSVPSAETNSASDGSKTANSMDQAAEMVAMEAGKDTQSPFSELYQMIKQDLDPKSPWKVFKGQARTPVSRRNSQKPETTKSAADPEDNVSSGGRGTPKKTPAAEPATPVGKKASTSSVATTPKSAQKKRRSSLSQAEARPEPVPEQVAVSTSNVPTPVPETPQKSVTEAVTSGTPGTKRCPSSSFQSKPVTPASTPGKKSAPQTPQNFSADQVVQQLLSGPQSAEKPSSAPKSPKRRSSSSTTTVASPKREPASPAQSQSAGVSAATPQPPQEVKQSPRSSPRANAGKRFKVQDVLCETDLSTPAASQAKPSSSKKRKSGGPDPDMPTPLPKKKRVSFGGQLSPELFDKRLPPDSPLRRGATPSRRSLCSGLGQTPKSLLRRASTIGLVQNLKLGEAIPESPKAKASPAKSAKTPSPAKKSPKAKTPSPKKPASPGTPAKKSAPATTSPKRKSPAKVDPETPKGRRSPSPAKAQAKGTPAKSPAGAARSPRRSPGQTPTVSGRFSISRISTPSPEAGKEEAVIAAAVETESATPKIPLRRRSSMKKSARRSLGKAALEVIRRRSGASLASLKVRATWADIVKSGQTKPQAEVPVKKANPRVKVVKKSVAPKPKTPKPKTPARRLQDHTSTGHANSPATIVVGRAQIRAAQVACGAPKVVPNVVLSNLDRRMDEDLSGVSDIFKTPANTKQRRASARKSPVSASSPTPAMAELSVMKTPEETGEMVVSPLSVVSTAKRSGRYNSDAVTRLLQDEQEASLIFEEVSFSDAEEPSDATQTPKQQAAPAAAAATCLTGIKRLLKIPKQKAEPLEDLRGRLLKTPKQPKAQQEESSLIGIKEMLKTPKQKAAPVEDLAGIQRIMKTPRVRSSQDSPVVCAAAMKRLVKTPKQKAAEPAEEDLSGVRHLLKTPKQKAEPVEDLVGVKRLMQTPKEKPVSSQEVEEDLTGLKELVKTPKVKGQPVQEKFGISKLMKTPRRKGAAAAVEGLQELLQEPEEGQTQVQVIEVQEEDATEVLPGSAKELDHATEEDKENVCPVEDLQAADAKPKEPVDTEAKRELQARRLSSPLKELSLERALEGSEEPVEAEMSPLDTTEEAQKQQAAISQQPSLDVSQQPEGVCVEQPAAPEPTEAPVTGDALVPEPVPLPVEEVATPARGRSGRLVDKSAGTSQASPATALRGAKGPKRLQVEEEEVVNTTPKGSRKSQQVGNEEVVFAASPELVGDIPIAADEMQEEVCVPECAAEPIVSMAASVEVEPISPVDGMTETTEPALTDKPEPQPELPSSPAQDPAQEPLAEVLAEPTEAVADVPGTSQDLPEATSQDTPAPPKARRGRKLVDASESAAAVASPAKVARGRVAKHQQDEVTEAKPRRGRRTKQDSTEQAEEQLADVVVAATSEPVETPATETEEAASLVEAVLSEAPVTQEKAANTTAATAEPPKTTRGRKARQMKAEVVVPDADAEEQSEPAAESSLESESVAEASEPSATAPVVEEPAKPARGRKGRLAKAEVEDQTTAKDAAAAGAAAIAKPGRGRRAKQTSVEVTEEAEAKADTQPQEDQTSTTKQAEEQLADVAVVVAATSEPVETPATETEEAASLVEAVLSEAPVAQEEAANTTAATAEPPKTTRGRKARQMKAEDVVPVADAEEQSEPVAESALESESVAEASEPSAMAPVVEEPAKPARGRKGRLAKAEVEDQTTAKAAAAAGAAAIAKPGRGRRAKQTSVEVTEEAEAEAKANAQPQEDQTSLGEETQVKPQAKAAKATKAGPRGRKVKQDPVQAEDVSEVGTTKPAEEAALVQDATPVEEVSKETEPSVEAVDIAPVAEEPVKHAAAKAVRGRRGKQAPAKVQEEETKESKPDAEAEDQTVAKAAVVEKPAAKAVRGRRGKQAVEDEAESPADAEQSAVTNEESEEKPQAKQARSGRGRKAKQEGTAPTTESKMTPEAEPVILAEVTEEQQPAPAVKTGRGRKTKQEAPAAAVPESIVTPEAELSTPAEVTEEQQPAPAVKSGRGRKTKQVAVAAPESMETPEAELSAPAEVTEEQQQPAPAVKSGRGRKTKVPTAQVQEEVVEVSEAVPTPEEPASKAPAKRGRPGRKAKAAESDQDSRQAKETAETVKEKDTEKVAVKATKKSVNWSPDLTSTNEIESADPEVEEVPQKKKSKRDPATDAAEEVPLAEVKQAPKAKGAQRGRGVKKTPEPAPVEEEEPKPEDPEPVAKAKTSRRGRAAAAKEAKNLPDEGDPAPAPAPAPKRGGKRKEAAAEVEIEETETSAASPPKRRRGKAATPEEPQTAAAAAAPTKGKRGAARKEEEDPEVIEPPVKAAPKTTRGKRKALPEPEPTQDDASASTEDAPKAAPEASSSRGRGRAQKKAAEPAAVPADTAAPARRTRRK